MVTYFVRLGDEVGRASPVPHVTHDSDMFVRVHAAHRYSIQRHRTRCG
jgi:hypothetical protein